MATAEFPLALVIKAVDKATGPLREFNAKLQRIAAPIAKLGHGLKEFGELSGITRLSEGLKHVGEQTLELGKHFLEMEVVGGFALYELVKGSLEAGSQLKTMAQRVGLGVDAYAQLQFAAGQAHISAEEFDSAMDKFNKNLGQAKANGGPLLEFLNKVSPALAVQVRGAKNTEEALQLMTKAFEKVTDPSKRAALSAAAFGKAGLQWGQFLGQGNKAIDASRKRFEELAGSQEEFAERSEEAEKALKETAIAFSGLRNAAATQLFPALTELAKTLADFLAANRDGIAAWAKEAAASIQDWIKGGGLTRLSEDLRSLAHGLASLVEMVGGFGNAIKIAAALMAGPFLLSLGQVVLSVGRLAFTALAPVVAAIGTFVEALGAGFSAMEAFNLVLLMNPIGLVIAGVAALAGAAYLIYKHWDPIKKWFVNLWDTIVGAVTKAYEKIKPYLEKAWAVLKWTTPIGLAVQGAEYVAGKFGADQAKPTLGAAQAAPVPSGTQKSETKVAVEFNNLPRGARVTQDSNNSTPVDLDLGYSMVTP